MSSTIDAPLEWVQSVGDLRLPAKAELGTWLTLTQAGLSPASRQIISSPHVHRFVLSQWWHFWCKSEKQGEPLMPDLTYVECDIDSDAWVKTNRLCGYMAK